MPLTEITKSHVESALALTILASNQVLTHDVLPDIYRHLEPSIQLTGSQIELEDSLIKLARMIKKYLFFDNTSNHFIIQGESTRRYIEEIGEIEDRDIIAKFELLDSPPQVRIYSDFKEENPRNTKTLPLIDFTAKTNGTISKLNQHTKIHEDLAKINETLKTHSSFTSEISTTNLFNYLNKDLQNFRSFFNLNDESGANFFQSPEKNILSILADGTFRLKHIDYPLSPAEFSAEVEKIKKLSELAKIVEDTFPNASIKKMENHSNPLLPIILIIDNDATYKINNESITIKNSSGQTIKTQTLEEFVS